MLRTRKSAKRRKALAEYVRLRGYKNGEAGRNKINSPEALGGILDKKLTLSQIADELGISLNSLKRSLSIERNLTESMKEMLGSGTMPNCSASRKQPWGSHAEQKPIHFLIFFYFWRYKRPPVISLYYRRPRRNSLFRFYRKTVILSILTWQQLSLPASNSTPVKSTSFLKFQRLPFHERGNTD